MVTFNPLKHVLVDRGITLSKLCEDLSISTTIRAKLNQDQFVSLATIVRICKHLDVPIEKVVEVIRK